MQLQNPKISIIVPAYNAANYISRCIESIICQTESDFEILIIDDGSSDSTGKICKEYQARDSRLQPFVDHILTLITDPRRLRAMQLNALHSAHRFTLEKTMEKWKTILI